MIQTEEDLKAFTKGFGETVMVDGRPVSVVFSKGSTKERTIRGTVISDSRSFLVGIISWAEENSKVEVDGQHFEIDEIQEKAGIYSYYLRRVWDEQDS
ncbi:MAG: hypothetical protein AB8G05_01390 [Oligoflexales bacterium]